MQHHSLLFHFLEIELQSESISSFPSLDLFYASNELRSFFAFNVPKLIVRLELNNSPSACLLKTTTDAITTDFWIWSGRWLYKDGCFLAHEPGQYGFKIEFNVEKNTLMANLEAGFSENPDAIAYGFLRALFQTFILPFYHLKMVHAAALVKGNRGILILGDSGSGKSTTALQMTRSGYRLLSDDGPLLTLRSGTAYALSSLDYLHLSQDTMDLFPELQPFLIPGKSIAGKSMINRRLFQPITAPEDEIAKITHIVRFNRIKVDRPRIARIDREAMLKSILNEFMWVFRQKEFLGAGERFREHQEFSWDALTAMVHQSHSYLLEFSDHHLPEISKLLERMAD